MNPVCKSCGIALQLTKYSEIDRIRSWSCRLCGNNFVSRVKDSAPLPAGARIEKPPDGFIEGDIWLSEDVVELILQDLRRLV